MNTQTKAFAIFIIGINCWCLGTEVQLHLFAQEALTVNFLNASQPIGSCIINNREIAANTCIFIIYQRKNYVRMVFLDKNEKEITESKDIVIDKSLWIKTYKDLYVLMKDLLRKKNPQFLNISDIELDKHLEATDEELAINSIQNFEDRIQFYNKLRNYIESMYNNLPENIEKKLTIKIDPVAYTPEISPKIVPPGQRSQQAALKPLPITLATSLDMHNMKIDEDAKIISMEYSNKSEPIAIFNNGKETVPISWYRVTIDKNKKTIRVELYFDDTENRTITNVDDTALNTIEALSKTIFAVFLGPYPKEPREEKLKILKNNGLTVQNIIRKERLAYLYNYIAPIFLVSRIFSEATTLKISETANQTIKNQTNAMLSRAPSIPTAVNTARNTTEKKPAESHQEMKPQSPSDTNLTVEVLRDKIIITFASASQSVGSSTFNDITARITNCAFSIYRHKYAARIVLTYEDGTAFDSSRIKIDDPSLEEASLLLYSFIKEISQMYEGSPLAGYSDEELDDYFKQHKIAIKAISDGKGKIKFYDGLKSYAERIVNTLAENNKTIPTIAIDPIVYIPKIKNTYNLFRGPKALLNYFSQKATSIRQQYITPVTKALWSNRPRHEKILGSAGLMGAGAAYLYYLYNKPISLSK